MVALYRSDYLTLYGWIQSTCIRFCHLGHGAATSACINLFGSITILRDVNKYCSTYTQTRSGCHLGKRAIIIRKSLVASI